jgi:hypothetical protein
MTRDLVTFGFAGDVTKIAALGFTPSVVIPSHVSSDVITLGFSRDVTKVATLGFGLPGVVITRPLELRQAVYSRLASSPAIAALVGARIHFGALPQSIDLKDGPALTFAVISRPYGHVLTGSDGTSSARVQITAHSYRQAASDQLIQAVRDSFDGFVGTIGGLVITATIFDNEVDLPSPPFAGTDQWTYAVAADYQINHRVSLPANLN